MGRCHSYSTVDSAQQLLRNLLKYARIVRIGSCICEKFTNEMLYIRNWSAILQVGETLYVIKVYRREFPLFQ